MTGCRVRGTHLAKAAEALGVDGGLVDENLVGAVVGGDEPEALLGVEPLHLRRERVAGEGRIAKVSRAPMGWDPPLSFPARRRGSSRAARRRARMRTLPVSLVIVMYSRWCLRTGERAGRGSEESSFSARDVVRRARRGRARSLTGLARPSKTSDPRAPPPQLTGLAFILH